MEIRRKRCSAGDGMLTPTVKFDIFITISHLGEFTKFEQQVCSTTQMHYHWEQFQKNGTWQLWIAHIK